MSEFEFTNRYEALGIPYPDPKTVCDGDCEGTGYIPLRANDLNERYRLLWKKIHALAGEHECDGYHFVKCPDCGGTGRGKMGDAEEV